MSSKSLFLISSVLLFSVACGDGSSSSGSGTTSTQFTQTTANVFTDFSLSQGMFAGPQSAITSPLLANTLFIGYNTGADAAFYMVDISTTAITRAAGSPFILPGSSNKSVVANINVMSSVNALICASDNITGDNTRVYIFNPQTINDSGDIQTVDLSPGNLLQVTPLPAATDSNSTAVTAPYRANFPTGAALFVINNVPTLFVGFSNSTGNFPIANPGTILVYELNLGTSPVGVTRVNEFFTTRFNPTALAVHDNQQGQGPLIYLTCEGAADINSTDLTGSVEIFSPTTLTSIANLDLGTTNPTGKLILNDQGTRGYITGIPTNGSINVHEIDVLSNITSQSFVVQEQNVFSNFSNAVTTSRTGDFVYVQLSADRTITIFDRVTGMAVDRLSTPTPAPRSTSPFADAPNFMVRRTGDANSVLFSVVGLSSGLASVDVILPTFR